MQLPPAIYRLAVSCWVGGALLFTFILTPTIFKSYSRDIAGEIVSVLFPGYFKWGLACGVIAIVALFFSPIKNKSVAAILIIAMLALSSVQAFVIEPKAAALKKEIPSFETTPTDHPLRAKFRKLHGVSAVANLAVIGGGIVLVILL